LQNNIIVRDDIKKFFNVCDSIFHPSQFTFNEYSKYYLSHNFKIINHNDYINNTDDIIVPTIKNNTIIIGFMQNLSTCKGKQFIIHLMDNIYRYKNYDIKWIFPSHGENNFFDCLKKHNINCLVHLNLYGETWCYALSKSMLSGLPIIYNNFGSFKERMQRREHYFKVYDKETDILHDNNYERLCEIFKTFIDYVILNNGINVNNVTIKNNIVYNYEHIFYP
jgi:hypothetical protein